MFLLTYNVAGTVAFDLPERADASPTYVVKAPSGGTLQSGTATLDSVNTTLAGAAAAGAQAVSVASASGVTAGRKYLLTGSEDAGGERATVRSVSGTTVTLVRPLQRAHAAGAAFASTRVSCAVGAIAAIARHHRVEVTWTVASAARAAAVRTFDVVRFVPESTITSFDDVADYDPVLGKRLPAGSWFPALREEAWGLILDRVAAKVDPGAVVSAAALSRAHKYLIRTLLAETGGKEWEDYRARMATRFGEELDAALGAAAVDADQDGALEPHEGWFVGVDLARG